jgi:hypothetical protein
LPPFPPPFSPGGAFVARAPAFVAAPALVAAAVALPAHAHVAAAAEKRRIAHREQELKGQLAAEEFYKGVLRIAELGEVTQASSKSMELGVAFDTMLFWTKEHFPDCDVTMEIRHLGPNATYAIRVGWGSS